MLPHEYHIFHDKPISMAHEVPITLTDLNCAASSDHQDLKSAQYKNDHLDFVECRCRTLDSPPNEKSLQEQLLKAFGGADSVNGTGST